MSSKEYLNAYEYMTDNQKEAMSKLYMKGINHDGHSWVTYGDVEECVAEIIRETMAEKAMLAQYKWESSVAIAQLKDIGCELGCDMKNVKLRLEKGVEEYDCYNEEW